MFYQLAAALIAQFVMAAFDAPSWARGGTPESEPSLAPPRETVPPPRVPPPASPTDAKKAAAREKLVAGDRLLKQGEFQQALAAFKEAYVLFPSAKIHYNFGLAYQGMGRIAEALDAFDAFLEGAPDAQPEVRERARATLEGLMGQVGTVRVTADLDGASVIVDGRDVGKTPLARNLRLDPGPHLLLVDGGVARQSFTQRLNIVAGASTSAAVILPLRVTPPVATAAAPAVAKPTEPSMGGPGAIPAGTAPLSSGTPESATPSAGRSWRVAGIAVASAGAVCLAAGLVFGLAARSASNDVSARYDESRDSAGKRNEALQWVGYGVGAAAVAAGAFLFVHGAKVDEREAQGLHAVITPNGSVLVRGHF
ncbi:MAG: PEGA domain-containing protein [Myxococcales bacterium]